MLVWWGGAVSRTVLTSVWVPLTVTQETCTVVSVSIPVPIWLAALLSACRNREDPTAVDQWVDGVGVDGGIDDQARGNVRASVGPGRVVDASWAGSSPRTPSVFFSAAGSRGGAMGLLGERGDRRGERSRFQRGDDAADTSDRHRR